jgi:hypothetical protein
MGLLARDLGIPTENADVLAKHAIAMTEMSALRPQAAKLDIFPTENADVLASTQSQ